MATHPFRPTNAEASLEPVAPSEAVVAVLRAISRAGFAYATTRELAERSGWRLDEDEPRLGYVRYELSLGPDSSERRSPSVLFIDCGERPFAFVTLFVFEGYDDGREPFDRASRILVGQLTSALGVPDQAGVYTWPHRAGWSYSFAGWSLTDATLLLVQDEFDIQFGMDVTLWVQSAGTAIRVPVEIESSRSRST